ncbi:putative membrane protein [Frondihabitans sp. PhB188]|uniref:DoxX family protein n=1 Tax=Frondihabitans sp. PhB188 TaxID=2485200 RepID=UPI000F4A0BD3|nr:DoxX family membrane protein [Frondihabitans sp. PhB188]ROQ37338.1 putative membrane protein [Frondihabitans sp. PhB188]
MSVPRTAARLLLGGILVFAGASHLTFAREPFQAQVPKSITDNTPLTIDQVVLASGVVEMALGAAIASGIQRRAVGSLAATFFTAIFPGNLSQLLKREDAFGLDTDKKRALRLLGQPLLVAWALWSTRK